MSVPSPDFIASFYKANHKANHCQLQSTQTDITRTAANAIPTPVRCITRMNENDTYVNWRAFNRALGLAAVLLIFWTSACDTSPTVYLDDESPQRFGYRGRGYLEFFVVREIAPRKRTRRRCRTGHGQEYGFVVDYP